MQSSIAIQTSLPTVTVRGFLNFRTTVDGTVIVFTPSSSVSSSTNQIAPTQPPTDFPEIRPTQTQVQLGPVQSYPTGLVTVLGGTVVQDGSTTVYETKVIGTYISGKYAQILSSSIKVKPVNNEVASPTIRPTSSYTRPVVLVTKELVSDQSIKQPKEEKETTPNIIINHKKVHPLREKSQKLIESTKARHLNAQLQLNPLKSRWAKVENKEEQDHSESRENQSVMKMRKARIGSRRFTLPPRQSPKVSHLTC